MFSHFFNNLVKYTWRERFLLLEAFWRLGFTRATVLLRPFNRIASSLGDQGHIASDVLTSQELTQAEKIGWAVRTAARRSPWKSNCLAQAIAAKRMLQRRNISSTLYLGVQKANDIPDNLNAHAWVTCGDMVLTGKHQYLTYTVISQFGDKVSPIR